MEPRQTELSAALNAIADDADPAASDRLVAFAEQHVKRKRRRQLAAGAVGGLAAIGLIVSLNTFGLLGGDTPTETAGPQHPQSPSVSLGGQFVSLPPKPGEPCYRAVQYTLAELAKEAITPIWLPDSDLASEANLTAAWSCGGVPALDFASGVEIWFEPGWRDVEDIGQKFEALAADDGVGHVESILDRPALVQPTSEMTPRGQVLLVEDDVLIRVLGDGKLPPEALAQIAGSIDLSDPLPSK